MYQSLGHEWILISHPNLWLYIYLTLKIPIFIIKNKKNGFIIQNNHSSNNNKNKIIKKTRK